MSKTNYEITSPKTKLRKNYCFGNKTTENRKLMKNRLKTEKKSENSISLPSGNLIGLPSGNARLYSGNAEALIYEMKRRADSPLFNYNREKKHLKQLEFHKCAKKNRWVFGGNRSGKSECGAVECVWLLQGNHPYKRNKPDLSGWSVSLSFSVQRDVAQKKILRYLDEKRIEKIVMVEGSASSPEYGIIDYILVKNDFGGLSRLGFKSCESSREKFQGADLDFVWFDEEPPKDIYEECRMRLLDRNGEIFGTMTPLKGLTYIYDRIYVNDRNDPEVWSIFMEWADNPFLSPEAVRAMTASMSRDELETRRYGRFAGREGLVYPEFDPSVHIVKPFTPPISMQDRLSIDPGLRNPLSCHWYARDGDGNVFVVAEHYEAERTIEYHSAKIKEISDELGWKRNPDGSIEALIDSAANQKTLSGTSSVTELFRENGIYVLPKVDKGLFSGINKVKSMLRSADGTPRLFITENCVNLIREIRNYRYGAGDSPVKRDDHAMDELRYYLAAPPGERAKTPMERDKNRLYGAIKRGGKYE